jgi:hypothetical protein
MRPSRVQRVLIAAYPKRFRERYGEEIEAILAGTRESHSVRETIDLARGVCRAWLSPECGTATERRRDRVQTAIAAMLFAWCVSVCAAAAFARGVDDQPVPGLRAWGWASFAVGQVIFECGAIVAGVVGFYYWCRVIGRAVKSRDRSVLIAASLPVPIVAAWLGVTALVAFYGRTVVHHSGPPGTMTQAVFVAYVLVTLVAVGACWATVVRALDGASLTLAELRIPAVLGAAGSLVLVAEALAAAVAAARVIAVGHIDARTTLLTVAPLLALFLAAGVAVLASTRALAAYQEPVEIAR